MSDQFIEAQRKRKTRTKYWREHIVLAYAVVIGAMTAFYLLVFILDRTPAWLVQLGVGPSGAWLADSVRSV